MGIAVLSAEELRCDATYYTIVDARRRDEFALGHVPGAAWMGWEEWCEAAPPHAGPELAREGYWGVVDDRDSEALAERLAACGLRSSHPVVVYSGGAGSMGRDGRIAWMLLYLGACEVYLLDGGWQAWLAAGGAVSTANAAPPRGHFLLDRQRQRRAMIADLKDAYHKGEAPLFVDTRTPREYAGYLHPYLPRMGHLPGAALLPFPSLFDEADRYIGRDTYLERLPPAMRAARRIVTYCEVGVRASTAALLHEIYTGQEVAVFDGSLMQWGLDPVLPVISSQ